MGPMGGSDLPRTANPASSADPEQGRLACRKRPDGHWCCAPSGRGAGIVAVEENDGIPRIRGCTCPGSQSDSELKWSRERSEGKDVSAKVTNGIGLSVKLQIKLHQS